MEIMSHDEFWARNPAPDTLFVELSSVGRVTAREIDPDVDDPDDITCVSFNAEDESKFEGQIGVVSWGSWDDHQHSLVLHQKAVESMKSEQPEYVHICRIIYSKQSQDELLNNSNQT